MVVPGSGIMRACIVTVVRSPFVCPIFARDFVTAHGRREHAGCPEALLAILNRTS